MVNLINFLAKSILTQHITLSIFQNTPDTLVPSLQHHSPMLEIPQWRFFAPSPGIYNHHILYRGRKDALADWSDWEDLYLFPKKTSIIEMFWHPDGRKIKANFDLASSIINLSSYGASFEYIKVSEPYMIIKNIIRSRLAGSQIQEFQFLVASSKKNRVNDSYSFEPKLFSEIETV